MKTPYSNARICRFLSAMWGVPQRCFALWCVIFMALVLFALAEGQLLNYFGIEYIPKNSIHHVHVGAFSVSADGRWVASQMSFQRGTNRSEIVDDVVVHDLQRGTAQRLHLGAIQPCLVTISPTADNMAIACLDGSVYVLQGEVGGACGGASKRIQRLVQRSRDTQIRRLAFSPNERWLAVAGERDVHLLPIPRGVESRSSAESRSNTYAQLGGSEHWCAYRESEEVNGRPSWLKSVCDGQSSSMTFTASSRQLVMLNGLGEVSWWDTHSGQRAESMTLPMNGAVRTALSADGGLAALVLADGKIHCWDLTIDQERWHHVGSGSHWDHARSTAFEFSVDGRLLVTACWKDGEYAIHCYDSATGKCLKSWPLDCAVFKGLVAASNELVYSWDTSTVVRAWNVALGKEQWHFTWVPETDG